jgi:uncharacterized protein with von Willebrand factor type A (vWA) domain
VNEARLALFAEELRRRGIPVPVSSTIDFARSLRHVDAADPLDLYWSGRATLVKDPAQIEAFDEVFAAFSGEVQPRARMAHGTQSEDEVGEGAAKPVTEIGTPPAGAANDATRSVEASSIDILRSKRFDRVTPEEALVLLRIIRNLRIETPMRRSRRRSSSTSGTLPDLRTTLRHAASVGGEPIRPAQRGRRVVPRAVVMLLDISGSMRAYSRFLLQFGHAASRTGFPTHVFCFGTRVTRVTKAVAAVDPDRALSGVAELVPDWEGGTKIGESIGTFIDEWGRKGLARGAAVLICSDGMERADPAELGMQMARLARIAHQIVWINPLKGDVRYRPTARGMAAALPYIDVFRSGHNLASLESLARLLATLGPKRDHGRRAPAYFD